MKKKASKKTVRAPAHVKVKSGRGSPEAIEKRKVARIFNDSFGKRTLDGRSDRRRLNLLKKLGAPCKPIVRMQHVEELIGLGVSTKDITKACSKPRPMPETKDLIATVSRLHKAYGFSLVTYRFAGVSKKTLQAAGVTH